MDADPTEFSTVEVEDLVRDEGTILVFSGYDDEGRWVLFGADRRMGLAMLEALDSGEPVEAAVPDYAFLAVGDIK